MLRRKRKKRRFAERSSRLRMINLALLWEKKSLGYSQLNQILFVLTPGIPWFSERKIWPTVVKS